MTRARREESHAHSMTSAFRSLAGFTCALIAVQVFAATDPAESSSLRNYHFTVLAGARGTTGYVDGKGADARFDVPGHLAVDAAGNVYVTEPKACTVRKISPSGVVTTLAGARGERGRRDGVGSEARFNSPNDIAVDDAGNVYVADTGNHTIRKIDPAGKVTTLAGTAGQAGDTDGPREAARLDSPYYITIDGADNVFVGRHEGWPVWRQGFRKIAPDGSISTVSVPSLFEDFGEDYSSGVIRTDRAGNLYVIYYGWRVTAFVGLTPQGEGSYTPQMMDFTGSFGPAREALAFDDADNHYVKYSPVMRSIDLVPEERLKSASWTATRTDTHGKAWRWTELGPCS